MALPHRPPDAADPAACGAGAAALATVMLASGTAPAMAAAAVTAIMNRRRLIIPHPLQPSEHRPRAITWRLSSHCAWSDAIGHQKR
jgi:hypothetical protein